MLPTDDVTGLSHLKRWRYEFLKKRLLPKTGVLCRYLQQTSPLEERKNNSGSRHILRVIEWENSDNTQSTYSVLEFHKQRIEVGQLADSSSGLAMLTIRSLLANYRFWRERFQILFQFDIFDLSNTNVVNCNVLLICANNIESPQLPTIEAITLFQKQVDLSSLNVFQM